jgi:hypothetical protein
MNRSSALVAVVAVSLVAGGSLALAQDRAPGSRPLAVGDPPKVLYFVPGVSDSGSAENTGWATVFHCSSFSPVTETISFVIRNFSGTILANHSRSLASLATQTISTHGTQFTEDLPFLTPGVAVNNGIGVIRATSVNVVCSAMIVTAGEVPQGVALHMIRSNPMNGTQE